MCSMAKVSRGAITDLKMGRTKSLSLKTLTKIADYFGVTIDYLTGSKNLEQKEKPAQTQAKNQELDPAFFRVMKSAQEKGYSAHDIELAMDFIKRARERDKSK